MESNINFEEINKYSREFSQIVCDKYFENKDHIKGEGILLLTPVQQVNLFVILELLNVWKDEVKKLKSPYFNYQSDEVQHSLKKFMNVLSKNIEIVREDLEPLLVKATEKAILLIFSPYEFYRNEIDNPDRSRITYDFVTDLNKYVKINKHLIKDFKTQFEGEKIEEIFNDDALRIFNEVCENSTDTPEDFEIYITMFNEIKNPDITLFYLSEEEESYHDSEHEEENPAEHEEEYQNLNDSLQEEVETLADLHEKQGIEGIKKSITINQRFMFVNELFEGDSDEFESVVNYLDNCANKEEALDFINMNYVQGKGWDNESEEFEEFIHIVHKRFPSE